MKKQPFAASGDLALRPESVGLTWPRAPREDRIRGGVAVIDIKNPLEHHGMGGEWCWFDSYESILGRIEGAMQCEDVTSILLNIDSPGGEVSGLQETVRSIRAMRVEYDKPIVAFANDEAYSAAYAIACSADEIYLPEGGGVGSIGVLAELRDRTAMTKKEGLRVEVIRSGARKAEGHPDIPLTDETIAHVQTRVDNLALQFFALVAEVRPTSKKKLLALQGQCLYGQDAVDAGLADGVASFDEVLSTLADCTLDNLHSASDSSGTSPAGEDDMSFAVLEKKVATALAALNKAKTAAEKKKATAVYGKAVSALTEAKVKKTYEKKTTETETEEDDGEAVETEDVEDEEDDDPPADDKDDDEGDDEEDEEEEESKKGKKGKKAAAASGSLASFVKSLTGQSSSRSARQVLESMHEQAQQNAVNAAEIAKLKSAAVASARKTLISSMLSAGQLKPSQVEWAQGETVKSLRSFQKSTPAMFAPRIPPMPGADLDQGGDGNEIPGADGLTATERQICQMSGITHESYKKQRALSSGVPLPKVN